MDGNWLSIVPAIITIAAAIASKRILPSLLLGLLVGSYLLNPSIIGGIETALEHIIKIISDRDNLQVLLFLYLFSGLIALVKKSGGIIAFSNWVKTFVKSKNAVFYTLWALIPVTFIDCAFRVIGAGSITRPLAERNKIAKERLAFMLNNTASPVVELIPIATTFVGFNVANISQGLKAVGGVEKQSAYGILLRAIPFEFFSIVILVITFLSIFFQSKGAGRGHRHAKTEESDGMDMAMTEDDRPEIEPRMINLVIPMLSAVFFSFYFFWYFGKGESTGTVSSIIAATDPNKAMLVALFISLTITGSVYFLQKYTVKKMTADVIAGGNQLMNILAILIIAWSLGAVSQDLHLSDFIKQELGNSLPAWSVPASLFAVASAVTYFIGEGWAAASLIMPFAIAISVSAVAGIPICVAAVITGGTFGDVTSPVAGMTNMSSSVAGADHMRYVKYASPYNFSAFGLAALLFVIFGYITAK